MPTYLWWILGNSALQTLVNVVLICVLVHYAREGAGAKGELTVHERIYQEGKTISMEGRK